MDPEIPQTPKPLWIASPASPSTTSYNLFSFSQLILRFLAFAFALAGAIAMITSHQSTIIFGIEMEARYGYSAAFRFKLITDFIVCGLSVVAVLLASSICHPTANKNSYFYMLLLELVSLLVLLSGCSAATAIGYVGKYGQDQSGWMAICDHMHRFCNRIQLSIILSFLAVACLLLLIFMGAFKLRKSINLQGV